MNLSELQARLRHFAAERDWDPFHTPKNLTTALMVEAAELAEIFQWMTPEQSRDVHLEANRQQCIADEVADVFLYLLQVADHCQIDVPQAVTRKLARNAERFPAVRTVARVSPTNAAVPGVHVLLDYENVQPSEDALREIVPGATQVWLFHGPHQKSPTLRFSGFGDSVTAVPISKTGKNALDFHLSFYMGYIASRNPSATMVVVTNDKGYEPMLEHARAIGFAVRQLGYGDKHTGSVRITNTPQTSGAGEKKAAATAIAAKKTPTKKAGAKKATAKRVAIFSLAPLKPDTKTRGVGKTIGAAKGAAPKTKVLAKSVASAPKIKRPTRIGSPSTQDPGSPAIVKRLIENLRKLGEKRPTKISSLRRMLKSWLGVGATDDAAELGLRRLIDQAIVREDSAVNVSYPLLNASRDA